MKISIRPAHIDDAAALADLIGQLGYPVSDEECHKRIQSYAQPNYLLLIAEREELVVGYIALHIYDVLHLPAAEGRISSFCVTEKMRGTGIGNALLRAAEDYFKENSCYKIVLNSNLKRPETHQYYLHRGYQFTSKHFAKFLMN
jgi:N-acetylglutamate synthase-like GNAT family acetyltransferase